MTTKNLLIAYKAPGQTFSEAQAQVLIAIATHETVHKIPAPIMCVAKLLKEKEKKVQARVLYLKSRGLVTAKVQRDVVFCSMTDKGREVFRQLELV